MTMHGTTMIFLVVVPIWAGFGNYFVPLMLGARDMAFPRINAWSYWMFLFGGIVLYASLLWTPPEAAWTSYPPLSSKEYSPWNGQEAWIYTIHLTGLSSMLGAVNLDRKSTRLNSSHANISYAVFCLKKKKINNR